MARGNDRRDVDTLTPLLEPSELNPLSADTVAKTEALAPDFMLVDSVFRDWDSDSDLEEVGMEPDLRSPLQYLGLKHF